MNFECELTVGPSSLLAEKTAAPMTESIGNISMMYEAGMLILGN